MLRCYGRYDGFDFNCRDCTWKEECLEERGRMLLEVKGKKEEIRNGEFYEELQRYF